MPQGLHNSPAIFHKAVSDVLGPLCKSGNATHYVDDILVAKGGSRRDHLELVDTVVQALGKAGFK